MRDGRGTHFEANLLDLILGSLDPVLAAKDELADAHDRASTGSATRF
jgi:hypothetical protein